MRNGARCPTPREILIDYFKWGGTVILTGQNIRDGLESSDFTEQLFGIRVSRAKSAQKRLKGLGLGIRLNAGSSAKNQDSPEEIMTTSSDAEILLTYMNNQGAMSERKLGKSRAYYLGFGLEGLSTRDRETLTEIMFERSSTSLLEELKTAHRTKSISNRMQILGSLDQYMLKDKIELVESIRLLELMNLKNTTLYRNLRSINKFQNIHE